MKIGIDIRTLMDARYSGVPEYTHNLIKEILMLDSENKYRLFYNSLRDVSGRMARFNGQNVEVIATGYPNKVFNYVMQLALKWPKVDRLLGGVDLFFMPHMNFAALSNKCRKIITIHDLSFLRYPEFFSVRKNFWHEMIGARKLLKQFDLIVAVSENTKRDIVELCNVSENKVRVIYSGVGGEYGIIKNSPKLDELKRKYDLPKKFILYLGTLEPRKNVAGVIQAYNQLRNRCDANTRINANDANRECIQGVKLVIAGGRGWKSKEIFKEWQKSKFKDDIKFLGYVDKRDKPYLYNLASLFVYPSFYEGFGFPPLEAMACGCPVITSTAASLPEVAGEGALMVNPYNINEAARAMYLALANEELRDGLIKRGLAVAEKYSWKRAARNYLRLFEC